MLNKIVACLNFICRVILEKLKWNHKLFASAKHFNLTIKLYLFNQMNQQF